MDMRESATIHANPDTDTHSEYERDMHLWAAFTANGIEKYGRSKRVSKNMYMFTDACRLLLNTVEVARMFQKAVDMTGRTLVSHQGKALLRCGSPMGTSR